MHGVHTSTLPTVKRFAPLVASAAFALALGACSQGDVALNGKVFDLLGSATASSNEDVKIAPRPGLVVPPNLTGLPQPGANSVPDGQLAQITDADASRASSKTADKAALQAKQDAYCKVNYTEAKQHGDDVRAEAAAGPLGLCRPSALKLLDGINPFSQ